MIAECDRNRCKSQFLRIQSQCEDCGIVVVALHHTQRSQPQFLRIWPQCEDCDTFVLSYVTDWPMCTVTPQHGKKRSHGDYPQMEHRLLSQLSSSTERNALESLCMKHSIDIILIKRPHSLVHFLGPRFSWSDRSVSWRGCSMSHDWLRRSSFYSASFWRWFRHSL